MLKQSSVKVVSTRFKHITLQIPHNWESSQVSEVTEVLQGGISRLLSPYDIGYVILTSENIQNSNLDTTNKKYWYKIDNQGVNLKKYILDDGDIILNFINSTAQIGKSCIFKKQERDWIFTTNVFRIKVNKHIIIPEFFHKLLQTKFIQKQILAITQPAINQASFSKTDFNKVVIYYPPLKYQQKIASILSIVDELIQKTEQMIEQTQRLKKGLMQLLLTKGIGHNKYRKYIAIKYYGRKLHIPSDWRIEKLSNFIVGNQGVNTAIDKVEYVPKGFPMIKAGDIRQDLNLDMTDKISKESFNRIPKNQKPQHGDILYANIGSKLGTAKHVNFVHDTAIAWNVFLMRSKDGIDMKFLAYYLNHDMIRTILISKASLATMPFISKPDLLELKIIMPTKEEQEKIASVLSKADELIQKQQTNKSNFENLKKGLMQQLLTGKIRVKV